MKLASTLSQGSYHLLPPLHVHFAYQMPHCLHLCRMLQHGITIVRAKRAPTSILVVQNFWKGCKSNTAPRVTRKYMYASSE